MSIFENPMPPDGHVNPLVKSKDLSRFDEDPYAPLEEESAPDMGEVSDGYHTFNELYSFRKVYNALLFNEWAKQDLYEVHKAPRHFDGEHCFGGGWFIVTAELPTGQVSNHYPMKDWDLFKVPAHEVAMRPWDGHTSLDALRRLEGMVK